MGRGFWYNGRMNTRNFRLAAALAAFAATACAGTAGGVGVAELAANLPAGAVRLQGAMGEALALTTANRLKKVEWTKLVDVFRFRDERDGCWRSEFWGKIVRSAIHAWRATGDAELRAQIDATVRDLLSTQTPDGCISSYPAEFQTRRWDVWGRKYVLLGLVRYYEVVERDEEVKAAAMKLLDHLMTQIGPGIREITCVGEHGGLPASSILGAVMGVYRISGERRYLDFAKWIVSRGCSTSGDIFEAARAGVPAQFIANGKAYELTSCYQGFGDLLRADGTADDVALLQKYFRNVRDTEIFVTGTGGGKDMGGEFWYGGANLQAKDIGEIRMGETCITTEWIRYMDNVYRLTLDPSIADELERTFYNALLGAMTPDGSSFTHGNPNPLGKSLGELAHGYHMGWGYKEKAADQIRGFGEDCCLAQGPEGVAMAPLTAVMKAADGLVLNAYEALEADYEIGGEKAMLKVEGGFPFADGSVQVTGFAAGEWTLKLRIPYYWNSRCSVKLNGEALAGAAASSYLDLKRTWSAGDRLEIAFDLSPREQISPDRSSRALLSGPLVLASDSRFTRTRTVDVVPGTGWRREPDTLGELRSVWRDSRGTRLTDYASAGNRFSHDNRLRVWFDRVADLPGAANPDPRLVVPAGGAAIKVGTSNVKCPAPWDKTVENHWTYRSPFLFDLWRAQRPDLLGLQEPVAEYMDEIAAAFPEWDFAGVGREGGRKGEFSPVFWRRDRFERLRDGTFWLSGNPDEVGSVYPGANHPRICTFACLKDRRTGRTVAFYNTHASYVSEAICAAQLAVIVAHMQANAPAGAVRILTGDLNFEAGGAALKPLFDAGLVDADAACEGPLSGLWNTVTLYRVFPKSAPAEDVRRFLAGHGGDLRAARAAFGDDLGSRIDHVFVSPEARVMACGVDDSNRGGWYPSDHMPKFAVVELPPLPTPR